MKRTFVINTAVGLRLVRPAEIWAYVEELRPGDSLTYAVSGGKSTETLQWFSRDGFRAGDGYHQELVERLDNYVIMRIRRDA